jgi:hypothetical protein
VTCNKTQDALEKEEEKEEEEEEDNVELLDLYVQVALRCYGFL